MIFQAVRLASRCEPGGSRANRANDTKSFRGNFSTAPSDFCCQRGGLLLVSGRNLNPE
jgi:hypothetical protein